MNSHTRVIRTSLFQDRKKGNKTSKIFSLYTMHKRQLVSVEAAPPQAMVTLTGMVYLKKNQTILGVKRQARNKNFFRLCIYFAKRRIHIGDKLNFDFLTPVKVTIAQPWTGVAATRRQTRPHNPVVIKILRNQSLFTQDAEHLTTCVPNNGTHSGQ